MLLLRTGFVLTNAGKAAKVRLRKRKNQIREEKIPINDPNRRIKQCFVKLARSNFGCSRNLSGGNHQELGASFTKYAVHFLRPLFSPLSISFSSRTERANQALAQ